MDKNAILRFVAVLILLGACGYPAKAISSSPAAGDRKGDQAANTAKPGTKGADQGDASTQADNQNQKAESTNKEEEPRHKTHVRLGTITVSGSYTYFSNGFLPFYPYGYYPYSFFYSPFYAPFYGPFYYQPYWPGVSYSVGKGQVKLELAGGNKDAEVYIDNAYAGVARDLKSIWLEPGAYDFSVVAADGSSFQQRLYVLSGKTLKIKAVLTSPRQDTAPEERQ